MKMKTSHHWLIYPFFKVYTLWAIKRSFSSVRIAGDVCDRELPVLLLSHHISWWDGFWANYLNMLLFRRTFWFMMLDDQLKKHWYFRFTGGYPVRKGSRSILESLRYTTELLTDKKNLVLLFPQGNIHSMHVRDFVFEKGVEYILRNTNVSVQILFVAFLVDYFSEKKPSLTIFLSEYGDDSYESAVIGESYTAFYRHCLEKQIRLRN
jgi:1-acyl-sn-glycerol-3-phosphate acyltransferase